MANTASAIKRVRSNNRKRVRNKINRSSTRTAVREVDRLLANVPLLRVDLGRRRDVGNVFDLLKGLSLPQQGAVGLDSD